MYKNVEIVPGITDHDIMIAVVNVKPQIAQQKSRSVPLNKKADLDSFRKYILEFASDFMLNYEENKTVEQSWNSFISVINQGISKFIPIKRFGAKRSLLWITKEIKRLVRKRDRLFQEIGEEQGGTRHIRCTTGLCSWSTSLLALHK